MTTSPDDLRFQARTEVQREHQWRLRDIIATSCFSHCVPKYGDTLSTAEKRCLKLCTDRYRDAHVVVALAYATRFREEDGVQYKNAFDVTVTDDTLAMEKDGQASFSNTLNDQ
mmetsp:Transcript_14080/g.21197  ORF Transcript_14080/g.21197 Transcript_14080/m.21197 type:complete len:113 (+) Transcript_14080:142-480(+)